MSALKLTSFAGMLPIKDPRSIPDVNALDCLNFWPDGSALHGIAAPTFVTNLLATTRKVYRIVTGAPENLANSFWMQFSDPDTDVVRTPNVNDSHDRYYWCSPSGGIKYQTRAQILAGATALDLGVAGPTTAPNVSIIAGTGSLNPDGTNKAAKVTRSYVYTFISIYGEESQPSLAGEASGPSDADWLIRYLAQPVNSATKVPISKIRIYRTITGTDGTTTFFKVVDLNVGQSTYTDRLTDLVVSGGVALESDNWEPPPSDLKGIIGMPNGIIAGFKNNTLFFSENYRPHAWPSKYQIAVNSEIVGLGVFSGNLVVCTSGRPVIVNGVRSSTMAMSSSENAIPCLSRRGIVSTDDGVIWPTDTGLVLMGPGGLQRLTDAMIGRDAWAKDYAPSKLRGVYIEGVLIMARDVGLPDQGFAIRVGVPQLGVTRITTRGSSADIQIEVSTGKGLIIDGGKLYEFMPAGQLYGSYSWKSKEFQTPAPTNMAVAQVFFQTAPEAEVTLRVYAYIKGANAVEKKLMFEHDIGPVSGREVRLPNGYKSDLWQVEVLSNVRVHSVVMASTVAELRNG